MVPEVVQVMGWDEPAVQLSPPLGDVTVSVAGGAAIVNGALLTSAGVPPVAWLIRTRQFADTVFGTVQAKLPLLAVEAAIVAYVDPPSVEDSIFTFPTVPVVVQVIARDDPTVQLSPPLGDVTVSVGAPLSFLKGCG